AFAAGVGAIGGLLGVIVGVANGNVPLAVAAFAVVLGSGMLPAVADWREATGVVEAIRRENHEQSAIATPERCVKPQISSREEAEAKIKAYYARVMNDPYTGSGRFQERVSAE